MILVLLARLTWAVVTVVWEMAACSAAGHPGARWSDGIRRCTCGRTWPA